MFLNQCKYRFADFKEEKNELYLVKSVNSQHALLTVSEELLALSVGSATSGRFLVLPTDHSQFTREDSPKVYAAHSGAIAALQFSPFNNSVLASAGASDASVKLWSVSATLESDVSEADAAVRGLASTLNDLQWHPSADNIVALAGKQSLHVVDLHEQKEAFTLQPPGEDDWLSLSWNWDGSLLGAVGKNAGVVVGDARAQVDSWLSSNAGEAGVEMPSTCTFAGREESQQYLYVFGTSRRGGAVMATYDPRKLGKALSKQALSSGRGKVMAQFDYDTDLMCVALRGSTGMSVFDTAWDAKKSVRAWTENTNQAASVTSGLLAGALLPHRACNTEVNETGVYYALQEDGVHTFRSRVPRKTAQYDPSLYSLTADAKAAQTAAEFVNGGAHKAPLLVSMDSLHTTRTGEASKLAVEKREAEAKQNAAEKRASEINYTASATRKDLDSKFAVSPYRHLSGGECDKRDFKSFSFDLKPGNNIFMQRNIVCNDKFWAVPWRTTGGGCTAVYPMSQRGRLVEVPRCHGHSNAITALDLSPHDDHLLATCCSGGNVNLWRIPQEFLDFVPPTKEWGNNSENHAKYNLYEPSSVLRVEGKISRIQFHPFVADVLVTATSDYQGNGGVTLVNLSDPDNTWTVTTGEGVVEDFSFERKCRLLAITQRGQVHLVSLKTREVLGSFSPAESKKEMNVLLVHDTHAIVTGFLPGGKRGISLWDISSPNSAKELDSIKFGSASAALMPYYDTDSNVLIVAEFGLSHSQTYEVSSDGKLAKLNDIKFFSDCRGLAFLPKAGNDVAACEVLRSVRVSKDAVVPVSWKVPRKRLEFFQDDIFPDTQETTSSLLTANALLTGDYDDSKLQVKLVSQQPQGMTPLSQAPKEELTVRQQKYNSRQLLAAKPKPTNAMGHTTAKETTAHFMAASMKYGGAANKWDAQQIDRDEVDSDEWGSDSD